MNHGRNCDCMYCKPITSSATGGGAARMGESRERAEEEKPHG